MKNIAGIISILFLLAACTHTGLREEIIATYDSGQPLKVYYYDQSNQRIAEKEFYESGILKMEGTIANGLRNGDWVAYFPDGKVQSTGLFKDGLRIGLGKVYYENGQLMMEGHYSEDHKCGEWIFYDEQGYEVERRDFGPCD